MPLYKFTEYYFEGVALWTSFLQDKNCVFKQLIETPGLFVSSKGHTYGAQEFSELAYHKAVRKSVASSINLEINIRRKYQSVGFKKDGSGGSPALYDDEEEDGVRRADPLENPRAQRSCSADELKGHD